MTESPSPWACLDLHRWGVPFKLALMLATALVLLAGEGVLEPAYLAPIFLPLGGLLVAAERQAPGPGGAWRCLVALEILGLLVCLPDWVGWWPWVALAGALGTGIAARLLPLR